jgi:hypothetical protein
MTMTPVEDAKPSYDLIQRDQKHRDQLAMFLSAGWVVAISLVIGWLAWSP